MKLGVRFLLVLAIFQVANAETFFQLEDQNRTVRHFGTKMIYGSGFYSTDLSKDLQVSRFWVRPGIVFFIIPQVAVGVEGRYNRVYTEVEDVNNPDKPDEILKRELRFGPRAYVFLGGRRSSFTPYLLGGANYIVNDKLKNGEEIDSENLNLGFKLGGGLMLNLNKNVALATEINFDYDIGENPDDVAENINTQTFYIAFTIWGFLGD